MPSLVYFVRQADGCGPVKIGWSTNAAVRPTDISWSTTHRRMALLATVPGGQDVERRFHLRFLDHWIAREWFQPVDEIFEAVAGINAGDFDMASLPPLRSLPRELLWRPLPADLLAAWSPRLSEAA